MTLSKLKRSLTAALAAVKVTTDSRDRQESARVVRTIKKAIRRKRAERDS
jgi:hypothetical protein